MCRGESSAPESLSSAGNCTPLSLALAMMAGPMPLPRVLGPLPTTSGPIVHAGTGSAFMVAQVFGSRGAASDKRRSKVRAEASRWVNVVVTVARDHVRLDEGEVRERARGGIRLELGEGHEVGGQPVLQPGIVDHPGELVFRDHAAAWLVRGH
jgi:hypothetical protein